MTDKEWSTWSIWLHPRMALDDLIDLEIIENEYIRRLLAAESKIAEQRQECERLSGEVSDISQRFAESEKALYEANGQLEETRVRLDESNSELAETRRRLDEAIVDLKEYEDFDRQLEEFGKMLDGVEAMKRNYEKRIKELKLRIHDSRMKSSLGMEIEPDDESKGDSDDWLMHLPTDL